MEAPSPVRRPFRPRAAFTLIELLVVVSIITILVALLFVMAPGMLKKARQTQSLSNLHQVSAGLMFYVADNDGRFPPRQADGDNQDRWPALVHGYLKDTKVFAAPDDPSNFIKTKRNPLDNSSNNTSYIMNGGLDPTGDQSAGETAPPLVIASIDQPSKTILLGVVFSDPSFYLDLKNGDEGEINPRLFGTSNCYSFMDGSAREIDEKEYRSLSTQSGASAYLWMIHKP